MKKYLVEIETMINHENIGSCEFDDVIDVMDFLRNYRIHKKTVIDTDTGEVIMKIEKDKITYSIFTI